MAQSKSVEPRSAIDQRIDAKRISFATAAGMNPMSGRRFVYDAWSYTRLEAWQNLTAQQIPGAPSFTRTVSRTPWRKDHSFALAQWAWIYVG